jgi:NADH:ubiquinone oxidoreductase subunit 6 (subunit J)
VAILLALVLLIETGVLVFGQPVAGVIQPAAADYGSPLAIGLSLFSDFLLPFEVTSVLLLAAMVGVIVLTKEERLRGKDTHALENGKEETRSPQSQGGN